MKQNRDYSVECLVEEISLDNIIRKALIVFMIAVLSMPIYGDIGSLLYTGRTLRGAACLIR